MMVAYQMLCLFITCSVIQIYISKGAHSRTHRLLPLIMGLIALFNLFKVLEWITFEHFLFKRLSDLLMLQILYLVIHYVLDFMYMKLHMLVELLLFVSLLLMNFVLINLFHADENFYHRMFLFFISDYIIIMLILGTYAFLMKSYSKRESITNRYLYLGMLVPNAFIFFQDNLGKTAEVLIPASLAFSMIIAAKLILNGNIFDTTFYLQENIYDTSDIGIILFDVEFYFLDANMTAKECFKKEILNLKKDRKSFPYKGSLKKIADNPLDYTELKIKEKIYNCMVDPVYRDGSIRGYILYLVDITRHKEEIQEMEELKKQAEELTLSKSRFLAHISHDFRSPLHAIIGVADILMSKNEISESNKGFIMHTKSAANSLLQLVNSVLTFSKLENSRLELENKEYDFIQLLEELAQMCIINLQEKEVNFAININSKCPRILIGDELRVREMIQNILSNAIKFTNVGEIVCDIECDFIENDKVKIRCVISDTGEGISDAAKEKIFEEYISMSENKVLNGAGLGLSIVKQLSELMNGYVNAKRREDRGSEFILVYEQSLPIEEDKRELIEQVSINREYIFYKSKTGLKTKRPDIIYTGAKILAADDMDINRTILKEILLEWDIETVTVKDGFEAIMEAKKNDYDMILLDQMMPNMTGDEAVVELRKFYEKPIVLVTANINAEFKEEQSNDAFTDFLPKPIERASLEKILNKYLPENLKSNTHNAILEQRYGSSVYKVTIEAFIREIEPLADKMFEMSKSDIELFGTKAHGIKGVARQLELTGLSEIAEIMEMAAKTHNKSFIDSHIDDFVDKIKTALVYIKEELGYMNKSLKTSSEAEVGDTIDIDKDKVYEELRTAFDECDIESIEKQLSLLEKSGPAEDNEVELWKALRTVAEDFEYDEGLELLGALIQLNKTYK